MVTKLEQQRTTYGKDPGKYPDNRCEACGIGTRTTTSRPLRKKKA